MIDDLTKNELIAFGVALTGDDTRGQAVADCMEFCREQELLEIYVQLDRFWYMLEHMEPVRSPVDYFDLILDYNLP